MAKDNPKSPMDAALLGFFIIGFGHFYLRMWGKGILLILLTILTAAFLRTSYIFLVFFIISPVWAYYDAKSYNREWGYSDFGEKVTVEDVEEVADEGVEGETEKPNFCPNCGNPLLQEDKFCSNCGQPVYAATTQEVSKAPQTPTPSSTPQYSPITLRSRLGPVFWFVLVGAILGILFGTIEFGRNVDVLITWQSDSFPGLTLAFIAGSMGTIVFSIIGLIAGFGITEEKVLSALLIILAGVGILTGCFWGIWGAIFPAMLFFVGGALILLKKE